MPAFAQPADRQIELASRCRYFASGNIVLSNIETGLFMLKLNAAGEAKLAVA